MTKKTKESKACTEKKDLKSEKIERREALKRIARNSGSVALLLAFPRWSLGRSVFDETNIEGENELLAYYVSYSSWYSSYWSHYYSNYSSYYSYQSYSGGSYTSYYDDDDDHRESPSFDKGPPAHCFIDTLTKTKK